MKSDEFWLGVFVYALIIAAGFYQPIRKKIENIPWDKPIYSIVQDHFHPPVLASNPRIHKILPASKVRRILTSDRVVSLPAIAQDPIRQNREEKWKKIAAHPAGLGQGTESDMNAPPVLEIKTGSKTKSVTPEKKDSDVEEPLKG